MAEITDAEANERLDALYEEHPEVVEAVEAVFKIAHPRGGPVRLLNEVLSVLGMEQVQ